MSLQQTRTKEDPANPSGLILTYHKVVDVTKVDRLRRTAILIIGSWIDATDKTFMENNKGSKGRHVIEMPISGSEYDEVFSPGNSTNILENIYNFLKKPAIPVNDQPEGYVETNFFFGASDV